MMKTDLVGGVQEQDQYYSIFVMFALNMYII